MSIVDGMLAIGALRISPTAVPGVVIGAAPGRQEVVGGGKSAPRDVAGPVDAPLAEAAAALVEDFLRSFSRSLEFRVDEQTGNDVVAVIDTETGAVVRQIPSDEALASARYIAETLDLGVTGVLFNRTV